MKQDDRITQPDPFASTPYDVLIERAMEAERGGEGARALDLLQGALYRVEKRDRDPRAADVRRWMGRVLLEKGDTAEAEHHYRASLTISEQIDYVEGIAQAINSLATLSLRRGNLTDAETSFRRAARLAASIGNEELGGLIEQNLGIIANIRGEYGEAGERYAKALSFFRQVGDRKRQAIVLNNSGMLCTTLEEWDRAADAFREATEIAQELADVWLLNAIDVNAAELAAVRANWPEARGKAERARDVARRRGDRIREAEALRWLARVETEAGMLEQAERELREAERISAGSEDRWLEGQVAKEYGELLRKANKFGEAALAYHRAIRTFEAIGANAEARDARSRADQLPRP